MSTVCMDIRKEWFFGYSSFSYALFPISLNMLNSVSVQSLISPMLIGLPLIIFYHQIINSSTTTEMYTTLLIVPFDLTSNAHFMWYGLCTTYYAKSTKFYVKALVYYILNTSLFFCLPIISAHILYTV